MRNWGFYFTARTHPDEVGSEDLGLVLADLKMRLKKIEDGDDTKLQRNQELAHRRSRLLLYGRYVCFRAFLECAAARDGEITESHRERWLLIQLAPLKLLRKDIFRAFTREIGRASSEYLDGAIQEESNEIKNLLGPLTLFYVLDEAQALIKDLDYFRSDTDSAKCRPILSPIIKDWGSRDQNLIVSGTGLSMLEVQSVVGSAVAKDGSGNEAKTLTEVGGFDNEGDQQAYLEQYLPPGFLDTSTGKEIRPRVGYWLRGRFVFNAAL